jgi:predicted phosphodiesterase
MRLALLADVHGNLPALTAVLAATRSAGVDRYVVAGDLVGYGPFPNECVETVAALDPLAAVAGNHDLMALGRLDTGRCSPLARDGIEWTRTVLRPDTVRYLDELPGRVVEGRLAVAHGSLDDPEEYVSSPSAALGQLEQLAERFRDAAALVLGHTHRPLLAARAGQAATPRLGTTYRLPPVRPLVNPVLVNPGAVGQSRERRVHARFAVLDLESGEVTFRAVGYEAYAYRAQARNVGIATRSYHRPPSPVRKARSVARQLRRRLPRRT